MLELVSIKWSRLQTSLGAGVSIPTSITSILLRSVSLVYGQAWTEDDAGRGIGVMRIDLGVGVEIG